MKRIILTYGTIAGIVIITSTTINLYFGRGQAWLGYLVMLIAFCTIYVGVKQYRDQSLGGVIAFMPALLVGLGISAIASVIYVVLWEVYLYATDYEFIEGYVNSIIEDRKLGGASEIELAEVESKMGQFKAQYSDPLYRLPMTLLEVFPAGLLVSFVSAAVLRNHNSVRQAN